MNQHEMVNLIANGLSDTDCPKTIIIVGAGIAGLVAADLLKRAGHTVTILEAQHRVGGRIYTERSGLAPGLRAEMGAMRFPKGHALTMAYIERFQLKTEPFVATNPNAYIHLQGKRVRRKEFDPRQFAFDVHAHEFGKAPENLLKETLMPFYDLVRERGDAGWDGIAEHYDQFSLRGYLRQAGWSVGAIAMLSLVGDIEFRMDASFVNYLRDEYITIFSNMVCLSGGADALPHAFLLGLRENIKFGGSVVAIENTAQEATVTYNTLAGQFRETADQVIVTIPFSLLRHVEVTPPFSPRKRRAIQQLDYDSSARIFVQCSARFWEADGIYGGSSVTDLAIRSIHYPQDGQTTGRGALLASNTWKHDVDHFNNLPKDFLICQAIEALRAIHPQVEHTFEVAIHHHWGNDPYACGGSTLLKPGTLSSFKNIVMPEGRIYFAGEHCSKFDNRWVQGAIESAIYAAKGVHEARSTEGQSMSQSYLDQIRYQILQTCDGYDPDANPAFHQTLQTHFPGALSMTDYMAKTYQCLGAYGFCEENTMAMVSSCRDEIADSLFVEVIRYWGKTFNCCSLAGFIMMGKTGLAAAIDHTPIVDDVRRIIFYAMPHIAISKEGEIGKIYRDGVQKISHACGALGSIVEELKFSSPKLEMDMQDIEQTIIRQKILSTINYGDKPDLIGITKSASQIICSDVEKLLNTLDRSVFKYAVITGIQIHGPMDTHWIYPQAFYVVGSDLPGGQEAIAVF